MPGEEAIEFWRSWFSEQAINIAVGLVLAVGFFAVAGYLSLRFLRRLPDFEHKAKMIWGGKWFWAIVLAALTLPYLIMYLGITRTPYPMTSFLVALAAPYLVMALCSLLLHHQVGGSVAVLELLGARMKGKRFDFDSWLARQRQTRTKRRRYRLIAAGALLLMPILWAYFAVTDSYPFERELIELERVLGLVQALRRELDSPLVRGVFPQPGLRREPYELTVKVGPDTTPAQAEDLLQRTQRGLACLREPRRWRIVVAYAHKKTWTVLATGSYSPRARAEAFLSDRGAAHGRVSSPPLPRPDPPANAQGPCGLRPYSAYSYTSTVISAFAGAPLSATATIRSWTSRRR